MRLPNIYRHYKNNFYKTTGVALHSETLEELVVYKCLYENPSGELWVRPREMFESNIDGKPRFAPVDLYVKTFGSWPKEHEGELLALMAVVFPSFDPNYALSRVKTVSGLFLQIVFYEEKMIAFKVGYKKDSKRFYSWLGAVLPEWRGRGVGVALMRAQHAWAKEQGYAKVSTKTKNMWKSMLILNLREGFQVVSTEEDEKGLDIYLEKTL